MSKIVGYSDASYAKKNKETKEVEEYINAVEFDIQYPHDPKVGRGFYNKKFTVNVNDFARIFGKELAPGFDQATMFAFCDELCDRECIVETESRAFGDKFYGEVITKCNFIDELLALYTKSQKA